MKSHLQRVVLVTVFCFGAICWAASYFQSEFITADKAQKRWGQLAFDSAQFKSSDLSKRSPMAVDILKRSLFVGKSRKVVREQLGDPDSYFFSDTIYAYQIMPFPGANKEIWHLVFIPDENLKKVTEVKIHKKCCYSSPF